MILVGPSLGAAVAIDFAVNHPEAVSNMKPIVCFTSAFFFFLHNAVVDFARLYEFPVLHCLG